MADNADLVNEYDSLLAEDADQSRMAQRSSLFGAMQDNPEEFAQAHKLAKQTGLPAEAIRTNKAQVQQDVTLSEYDKLLETHPVLAEQYKDPTFAKLAIDDKENLSPIEQGVRFLKNIGTNTLAGVRSTNQGLWGFAAMTADLVDENVMKPFGVGSGGGPGALSNPVSRFAWQMSQNEADRAQQLREFNQPQSTMGRHERSLYSGFESLGSNLVTLPFALGSYKAAGDLTKQGLTAGQVAWRAILPLLPMGLQTAGQEYTKAKAKGLSTNESAAFGAIQGTTEISTEMIPVFKFLEDVGAGTPFLKMLAKQIVAENIGEQVATLGQDFTEWRFLQPEKTFGDYVNERPSAALDTFIATMATVVGQSSVVRGSTRAAEFVSTQRAKVGQAKAEAAQLGRVLEAAKNSKLRERDPETFAAFVNASAAVEGVEINDVYVDARTLAGVLNQAGIDTAAAAQYLPTLDEQLPDALARGGDVRLSVGELLATLPGSAIEKELLPHIRMSPDSLSLAEADVYLQQEAKQMQAMADAALATSTTDEPFLKSSEAVYQNILGQLTTANRFTGDVNGAYAKLVQNFYTVTAKRTGITPEAMFEKYPLSIQAVSPGGATLSQADRLQGETDKAFAKRVVDKREAPATLPETHGSYFNMEGATVVPLAQLNSTKTAEENQQGGDNGPKRMAAAAQGELGKRDPITVMRNQEDPTRFDIIDGNGTFTLVQKYGWKAIPVTVVDVPVRGDVSVARLTEGQQGLLLNLYREAALAKPDFDKAIRGIAAELGGQAKVAPLKAANRAVAKIIHDYDGDPTRIKDLLRATVLVSTQAEAMAAVEKIRASFDVMKKGSRNWLVPEYDGGLSGYRDAKFNIDFGNGLIGEVQVNLQSMDAAKEANHLLYEESEALVRRLRKEGRDFTDQEQARIVVLNARMKAAYDAAFASASLRTNSSSEISTAVGGLSGMEGSQTLGADGSSQRMNTPGGLPPQPIDTSSPSQSQNIDIVLTSDPSIAQREQLLNQGPVRTSDIGHKREKGTGRYVGAPDWVGASPNQLAQLRKKLRQLTTEGAVGRFWYENSSRAILDMVGGDVVEAEKFVSVIAIYSPNATVPANTSQALTAWYQYKAGLPIDAGFGEADKKAENLLRKGEAWGGIKTNSFYQNLMVEIDPSKLDEGVATMDMWIALAFDYGSRVLDQGPKYKFAEREIAAIAAEMGWKAHQVQAAVWVGIKARIDPIRPALKAREIKLGIGHEVTKNVKGKDTLTYEILPDRRYDHFRLAHKMGMDAAFDTAAAMQAKYDFADALQQRAAQISWEATPGATTGLLPELLASTTQDKIDYLKDVTDVVNPGGRDLIAEAVGLPPGHTIAGFSAWQGDVGAGAQTFTPVPSEGIGKTRAVKQPARELLNLYAAVRGLVLSQEAVVWHTPVYDEAKIRANGFEVVTNNGLSEADMRALYDALHREFGTWELAPGYTPAGARILNFVEGLDNKDFHKRVTKVLESMDENFGGGVVEAKLYRSDGDYISNDWAAAPNGEQYAAQIADANARGQGRSDLLSWAADLRARVAEVNAAWEAKLAARPRDEFAQSGIVAPGPDRNVAGTSGREGAVSLSGVHYSSGQRTELTSAKTGTGYAGAETARLQNTDDARLKQRIYFYVDDGRGVRPESGVGYHAHTAQLDNIYDAKADALDLAKQFRGNDFESAVLDAGFDGYVTAFGQGRAVVLLGDRTVPVKYAGMGAIPAAEFNQAGQGQTSTPEFKKWFGDSKVVDEKGQPLVVYHGTNTTFDAFDTGANRELGSWFSGPSATHESGLALGYARGAAESFAATQTDLYGGGDTVVPVFLAINNPMEFHTYAAFAEWSGNKEDGTALRARLIAEGHDGVVIRDSNTDSGQRRDDWVAFRPTQIKSAIGNSGAFDPSKPSILAQSGAATRGTFSPAKLQISLLQNADLSTFLHELGHHFLEVLGSLSQQPNASPQIVADFNALLKWFGVPDAKTWQDLTLDGRRPYHEKFAESFEEYLFEGKAPSTELQGIFNRFRSWMTSVYKSLQDFLRTHKNDLTPEVRQVMDRLLATDEQIASAENARNMIPLFESAKDAGMTESEWLSYQDLGKEATEAAVEQLNNRSMGDMKYASRAKAEVLRKLQAEMKEKRAAVRSEVEAETKLEPVYQAQNFLSRGELIDTPRNAKQRAVLTAFAGVNAKLNVDALKEMYGEGPAAPWRYLPKGRWGLVTNTDGIHPDVVAELFGFSSGDELVKALLSAEKLSDLVDARTDVRMLERYGDLSNPQTLDRAADEAVHNNVRIRFVATELRALSKGMNPRADTGRVDAKGRKITYNPLIQGAKEAAERAIARRRLRDIRPGELMAAEERASRKAVEARAANDLPAAITHKRNQLLNLYAARTAMAAIGEIETSINYLKKFANEGTRKNLDVDYLDQIDAMLERFDLRKGQSLAAIDKRSKLKDWIEAQEAAGFDPIIDDDLRDEAFRIHFRDMTMEQFRGLVDAIKNIEHLGRLKKKLLTSKDQREFDAVVAEIVKSIHDNATTSVPQPIELTKWDRVKRGVDSFFTMHRKAASLMRQMDGFREGPLWDAFVRPMNEAANNEARMRAEASTALHEIFKPLLADGKMSTKQYIKEIGTSLSREARLSVALNWGNEDNRQRLADGFGWNEKQVGAVLDTLNETDWAFVQQVWDQLDTYWQRIADKERRVSGVVPERVTPAPFLTKFGEVTGGYYPIKYNARLSDNAASNEAAEVARNMLRGAYTRATTRRGHTLARAESVKGRPVDLTFNTITGHLSQVTHDLAWHEWLIDANRLMRDSKLSAAVRERHGDIVLTEIRKLLPDIAAGEVAAVDAWERAVGHLRVGATIAALGYNLTTALMQPLGFSQSIVRIGPGWVGKGIVRFLGTPAHMSATLAEIRQKSDLMRTRGDTMQREINEIRNTIDHKASVIEGSFFYLIQKMQQVVDVPTWLGAYEKEFAASGDEARAVAVADQAVLDSQGGGQIKDLARIQRGGPLRKLWTNFYSFFSTTYNLAAERTNATDFKSPTEVALLAVDYLLLTIVPASLGALLRAALRGGDDDDDDSLLKTLIAENLSYLLGMIIGLREVTSGIQKALGVNTFRSDYGGPAGLRFLQAFDKLGKEVGDGDVDINLLKAVNNVGGVLFHYPSGQVNRTVGGAAALYTGDTQNPGVLLVGP